MKKRGMKKRVLAALMTACMVVGSVPGVSLADATTDNSGISYTLDGVETTDSAKTAITLNKEAKPAGDGKYDITLTVDATKAKDQIQVKPTEVAFVIKRKMLKTLPNIIRVHLRVERTLVLV